MGEIINPPSAAGGTPPARVIYEAGGNPLFNTATSGLTTEQDAVGNITIPAVYMGPNSRLVVEAALSQANNINVKTIRFKIGGTSFCSVAQTSQAHAQVRKVLWAKGDDALQWATPLTLNDITSGGSGSAAQATTFDFSTDKTLTVTMESAVGSDSYQLMHLRVVIENPAT